MAEIEKFEGDIFWNSDDTESAIDSPDDEMDNLYEGDIAEFEQAKRLPNFFGVVIGDKARYFDTFEEATAARQND
jgi:hypothetical protein